MGLTPDNVAYNMVLAACTNARQTAEVSSLLSTMPDVDAVTFNTRLKACCKDSDVARAFALFHEMKAAKIEPTQVTYGTLVECCTRAGALDKAYEVLKLMSEAGVAKNAVVYTSLIKGFALQGALDEAMAVFGEMRNDANVEPDVICYSVLIK